MTKYETGLVGQSLATRLTYFVIRDVLLVLCKLWFRYSISGR